MIIQNLKEVSIQSARTRRAFLAGGALAVAGVLTRILPQTQGAEADTGVSYTVDHFMLARSLGLDLYKELTPKQREFLNAEPISLETDKAPSIKLSTYTIEDKLRGIVFVTVGLADLVENLAHAKAIDTIQKGYFEKYVLSLAGESAEHGLKELPNRENPKFWTDAIKNEHLSNIRQMLGAAVAINMAHFYLGQFNKYATQVEDDKGKSTPINTFLTPAEWEEAMKAGVKSAMKSGLGIEGLKALYEAIDKMPKRPAWAIYFMPMGVKYKSVKKEMEKIEARVLSGQE